jgi:hypothetical protein
VPCARRARLLFDATALIGASKNAKAAKEREAKVKERAAAAPGGGKFVRKDGAVVRERDDGAGGGGGGAAGGGASDAAAGGGGGRRAVGLTKHFMPAMSGSALSSVVKALAGSGLQVRVAPFLRQDENRSYLMRVDGGVAPFLRQKAKARSYLRRVDGGVAARHSRSFLAGSTS